METFTTNRMDQVENNESQLQSKEFKENELASSNSEGDHLYRDMVNHIVSENKAYFRSQQIDDPDITPNERRSIVEELLQESHKKFLARFGDFIKIEHLAFFENFQYPNTVTESDGYEIQHFLRKIRQNVQNHQRDVKNRRFAAMQKLIDENDGYFSEIEMMRREPLLYDQLIGQYMTDSERQLRVTSGSAEESRFSNVLLRDIDMKRIEELRKQQQLEEEKLEEEQEETEGSSDSNSQAKSVHTNGIINDSYYPQVPPSFREHWGDFEDEPTPSTMLLPTTSGSSTKRRLSDEKRSPMKKNKKEQVYVSAEEKDQLRDEFYEIMCMKFLEGKDKEFDYTNIDENTEYDDLETQARDAEEKYFDADESDMENGRSTNDIEDDSDDELDTFMKELNKTTN